MVKGLAQKIYDIPNGFWFLAFAVGLICAQLIALAWLADGQVQKANLRDRAASANSVALAQCIEHRSTERMSECMAGGVVAQNSNIQVPTAEQYIAQYTGGSYATGNVSSANSSRVMESGVRQVAFVR